MQARATIFASTSYKTVTGFKCLLTKPLDTIERLN